MSFYLNSIFEFVAQCSIINFIFQLLLGTTDVGTALWHYLTFLKPLSILINNPANKTRFFKRNWFAYIKKLKLKYT